MSSSSPRSFRSKAAITAAKACLLLLLSSSSSITANDQNAQHEFYTECLDGSCVIELGPFNCTVALQKYEFSGNCCSLQKAPTGHCQLIITTGFCDYADKGYEQCMDDLDDYHHRSSSEQQPQMDRSLCGTVHMYVAGPGTEDNECPASRYTIPDPVHSNMLQQQQAADSSRTSTSATHTQAETEITIHATLTFQFTPGHGQPPSDKEVAAVLDETDAFFAEYLSLAERQHNPSPATTLPVVRWFQLDNTRSRYDYASEEATLYFSLIFAVPTPTSSSAATATATGTVPSNLARTRDTLSRMVSTSQFQQHIGKHVLEMGPRDHHDVFRALKGISFRSGLA